MIENKTEVLKLQKSEEDNVTDEKIVLKIKKVKKFKQKMRKMKVI